jgi:hypothetical protein
VIFRRAYKFFYENPRMRNGQYGNNGKSPPVEELFGQLTTVKGRYLFLLDAVELGQPGARRFLRRLVGTYGVPEISQPSINIYEVLLSAAKEAEGTLKSMKNLLVGRDEQGQRSKMPKQERLERAKTQKDSALSQYEKLVEQAEAVRSWAYTEYGLRMIAEIKKSAPPDARLFGELRRIGRRAQTERILRADFENFAG